MKSNYIQIENSINKLIKESIHKSYKQKCSMYLLRLKQSLQINLTNQDRKTLSDSFSKYVTYEIEPIDRDFSKKISKLIFEYDMHFNLVDPDFLEIMKNNPD